jgi:signal transduction histidine kinase
MHPFHIVLLVSCVACAIFGTSVLTRDTREVSNRLASAIIFGGSWWAGCELLWCHASDPDDALVLVKLSALGWVMIGPLGLQLMMELVGDASVMRRRLLRALYVFGGLYLLLGWTTPWVHAGVVATEWGWSYVFGPLYPVYYGITVAALFAGLRLAHRAYQSWPSAAERSQARGIAVGILVPLVVASVSDGFLPYLGIHVWHLGTFSISVLGATVAFTFYRYGYSMLAPGTFAREILDTMTDGLALLHLDGRIRRANPALIRMAGARGIDQLLGTRIGRLVEGFDLRRDETRQDGERLFVPLSGPSFPVGVATSRLVDRQGTPTGVVVLVHDLREVVDLRHRLVISGRMVAVGQLAAGVAHELNNPMAYVRANLSLLQSNFEKLGDGAWDVEEDGARTELVVECGELLEESIDGIDRATSIIRDIKSFSHAGTGEREETDLCALLDATQRMVEPQIRHCATIEREDAAPLPRVRCAPREIQQVFVNLLLNAADAVDPDEPGRFVRIRIRTTSSDSHVIVEVQDDGTGIAPDALQCVFDPFYTTKPAGQGTGLGLSISYEIVRRHGGELRVQSAPGRGACFTLMLPLDPETDAAPGS